MLRQLAGAVWLLCATGHLGAQRRSTMELELILPRRLYLTGEQISVDIQLTNTGTVAVDAPTLDSPANSQPVYRLQGPSYPHGVTFNFRDSRLGARTLPAGEPSTHHLMPSATMATGFTLNSIKPVSEPGEYSISARIDWGGWSAEAAPVKFHVEKAAFVESSLGVDVYSRSARTVRAVWIAETAGGRLLGESFLYEKRPDLGEVNVTGTRIIRQIGPKATNAFCPWINFDRIESRKFWHGWQEGASLLAFSDDEPGPRSFNMGSSKAQIVQPAFMSRSGDLEVLVLSEDRKTLRLVRFLPEPTSSPAVAWSIELPEPAVAVRLGIGPRPEGGHRVAAAISQSGLKMAVYLIRCGENSAKVDPPVLFDSAFVLPHSEPGVGIAVDGSVHASVLFAKHPGLRTLAVAELTSRTGQIDITTSDAGRTDAAVSQAWIAYPADLESPPVSSWLIRTAKGSSGGGDLPKPVTAAAPVVGFLQISSAKYALTLDSHRGPRLIATGF